MTLAALKIITRDCRSAGDQQYSQNAGKAYRLINLKRQHYYATICRFLRYVLMSKYWWEQLQIHLMVYGRVKDK